MCKMLGMISHSHLDQESLSTLGRDPRSPVKNGEGELGVPTCLEMAIIMVVYKLVIIVHHSFMILTVNFHRCCPMRRYIAKYMVT